MPDANAFDEMICDECTLKNDFLNYYSGYCVKPVSNSEADATVDSSGELNVTDCEAPNDSMVSGKVTGETEKKDASLTAEIDQCIQEIVEINKNFVQSESSSSKRSSTVHGNIPDSKRIKLDEGASSSSDICRMPTTMLNKFTGASFWLIEWRTKLCRCSKCMEMYKKNNVEFLLDEEDTVHAYQEKGKAKAENRSTSNQDETLHQALSGMDHVAQIEAVMAYNKLKKKLTEFLTSFVSTEQVVTAKDVDTFFQTMDKKE